MEMIPDSYKYQGPERRREEYSMRDNNEIERALHELSTGVKLLQGEITSLDQKFGQRFIDNRELNEAQLAGIKEVLEQQRRDNEQRRADDLQQHRDMIGSFEKQTNVLVDLYKNHEREQDARFDDIEARLDAVEKLPANKALDAREKTKDVVLGVLVTAGATALFATVAAIARWDDFVKWIGGIK